MASREQGNILGKILWHIRMFQTRMFCNGGRRILVVVCVLMQMLPHLTNVICITQVTFKLINKGLFVIFGFCSLTIGE